MVAEPRAYSLARGGEIELRRQYDGLAASLPAEGGATRLRTFESLLINDACPAINMTLPGCIRFLETGRYLNIYEVVAKQVGERKGPKFEELLRKKLGEWFEPRVTFEKSLRFRRDVHYAALNVGGTGPDYGECCVRFGPNVPLRYSTIFAGDPLRVAFDDDGVRILSSKEILSRFSVYELRAALAAVSNPVFLTQGQIFDRHALINSLDDRETIIEVHLYGAVRREYATEIAIQSEYFESLARRCLEYEDTPVHARAAKKFNRVRALKKLLRLTDMYGLRLRGESPP